MANAHSSAGVYTDIEDLSVRGQPVSTSTAVVVGAASKGPIGKRTFVADDVELEAIFGKGDPRQGFAIFCAKEFLRVGTSLYFTRVATNALTAGAYLTVDDITVDDPILRLTNFDAGDNTPLGQLEPLDNIGFNAGDAGVESTMLIFAALSPGNWSDNVSIRIRPSNPVGTPLRSNGHNVKKFWVDVMLGYSGPNSIVKESFLVTRHHEIDGNGRQLYINDVINNKSKLIRVKNNELAPELDIVSTVTLTLAGGNGGDPVTEYDVINGWELYEDKDEVSVNILINAGYAIPSVHRAMDALCHTRGDCVAILDVPSDKQTVSGAISYRRNTLNLNSHLSALYSPDLQVVDPDSNRKLFVPPSGHVAAAYAYTDATRALWYAPAGLQRGRVRVLGVRERYKLGARDALDLAQVNIIRKIPNAGYVIWGQETQQSFASALSNINVVRMINHVLTVSTLTANVGVFDPNDDMLRAILTSVVEKIVAPVKRGRGLYAYDVVCNEKNNTPDTIANGDVILDIYLDPTIPAKRIHVTIGVNPTGSTVLFLNN